MSDPVIKTIEKYAEEKGLPKLSGMQFNRVTTLLLCELIRDIKEMKSNVKKPRIRKNEKSEGSYVWDNYERFYEKLYKTKPIRNAMTNKICSQMVQRLGLDMAIEVVIFYLEQRDQFYIRNTHHLRFCLQDCETLATKMKSGLSLTARGARKVETMSHNAKMTEDYLAEKHRADKKS